MSLKVRETLNVQHNVIEIIERKTIEMVWTFEEDEK